MRKQGLRYERRSDDFDRNGGAFGRAAAGDGVVCRHGRLHSDFERLREEGTFALIQPIYVLIAGAVKEQGGSVKDFTGDALFAVADALEDAPLRACRTGLLIHERLAAASPAIAAKHGVRPQMRIGVNSGLAVVTQGESAVMTAPSDTVNVAARLQTLAEPGRGHAAPRARVGRDDLRRRSGDQGQG